MSRHVVFVLRRGLFVAVAVLAASGSLQAQTGRNVLRPWSCLTSSLAVGTPLGGSAATAGCPVAASTDLTARMRAAVINPPSAPAGLAATVLGQTIVLNWTPPASGGAPTSYILQAGSARGLANVASANTGSTLPTLTASGVPSGRYFFRVLARNASGTSASSNEVAVSVAAACAGAPGAPASLTSSVSGSDVSLRWTPPVGECQPSSYVIQAGSSTGLSDLANFNTGNASTSFATSGVPSGLYYVRVLAVNAAGTSGPSNELPVPVNTCPGPPGPVTDLVASVFGSTVSLNWAAASNMPTGYFIQAGSAPGLSDLAVIGTGGGYYIAEGVPAGTYYVRVSARNACGSGAASNEVVVTVGSDPSAPSVVVTPMHGFAGSPSDGSNASTIIQGRDGSFYGTTATGGPFNDNCSTNLTGCGTVFKMTASGAVTILHAFGGDGPPPYPLYPYSPLLEASDGNFYGTLTEGTRIAGRLAGGAVVFRMTTAGAYTKMADLGGASYGKIIQGTDGNFYGTTAYGGTGADIAGFSGPGAVFRMTPSGTLTYLHAFSGGSDGKNSYGGLVRGSDGNFYGMTAAGGGSANAGTIFRITPTGAFSVLHSFAGGAGGASPYGPLIQGSDGSFYGTTQFGGGSLTLCVPEGCGAGTAFKITPAGAFTVLHAFTGIFTPDGTPPGRNASDGYRPVAGLLQASDGNYYGTTAGGGAHGGGTAFVIKPDGSYTQLFMFAGNQEGSAPTSSLIQATDGSMYGTAQYGGATNEGAIFKITVR